MKRANTDTEKAKRINSILSAALEAFSRNGLDTTRMEDIAKASGVSKGTLYLYFKSKDALFAALVHDYASGLVRNALTEVKNEPDACLALRIFADELACALVDKSLAKILPLLIANAHRTPEIIEDYRQNIVEVGLPTLASLLQRGIDAGIFREHDTRQYATLIIAPAIQTVIFHALFENKKPLSHTTVSQTIHLQLDLIFSHLEVNHD